MPNTEITTNNIEAFMQQANSEALRIAADLGIVLDYSEESLKKVEDILEILHRQCMMRRNEEYLGRVALSFGSYIGQVIRRQSCEGTWSRDQAPVPA